MTRRQRWAAARRRITTGGADRGSAALYVAVMFIGLLAMAGLVLDGGAALAARGTATSVAQAAARAGADSLAAGSLRGGTAPTVSIDATRARQAALRVLSASGATGAVTVVGSTVTVIAHVRKPTVILAAVGVGDVGGTGHASASPLTGVTSGPG